MYEDIKERYGKGYIRDDQLARYVALDVITQEQAQELQAAKHGTLANESGGGGDSLNALRP